MPTKVRPVIFAATQVEPEPLKGSSTTSPVNEYISMQRLGSSTGNGAGWLTLDARYVANDQIDLVCWMKSSRGMVSIRPSDRSVLSLGSL